MCKIVKGFINQVKMRVDQILVEVLKTYSSILWKGECSGNFDYLVTGSIEPGTADPTAIKHDGLLYENSQKSSPAKDFYYSITTRSSIAA